MSERESRVALEQTAKEKTSGDFYAQLERLKLTPLWDRFQELTPPEPADPDPGIHYRWDEILPAIDRASDEVSVEEAERRVLMLWNPAFGKQVATTSGVYGSIQILNPGEVARPHRHTASAFRFVLDGNGGDTQVNGVHCPMNEGDLILTPNWCWHEHHNPSDERIVWFDGLDIPILMFFNAWFAEFGPVDNFPPDTASLPDEAFRQAGLVPDTGPSGDLPYSPMFRYAYPAVRDSLAGMPAEPDGSRRLRYTNPVSGGPVMPTMDLYMLDLSKRTETRPYRTMSNAIAVVVEGEGVTRAGDITYEWRKNDIFTLPHWKWITHTASTTPARLFLSTDRALLGQLGLLREERA